MNRSTEKLVGVTVLPEYAQSEGVAALLDRLQSAGVNALTTSPYIMEPASEEDGSREPPIDAGAGSVRLLDRPLWGQRELWVKTSPSFRPNQSLYAGLRYQPPPPDRLTQEQGSVVSELVDAALARGMEVYFQVQSAIPPGYRVQFGGPQEEDLPRMHDGRVPAKRVANNGSLASPEIIAYQHALLRDLLQQYPNLSGLRVDWPEYPPYSLDDMFVDFSPHAERFANESGFDFGRMQADVTELYNGLHGGLDAGRLTRWAQEDRLFDRLLDLLLERPGLLEWVRFKTQLSTQLVAGFRSVLDDAGGTQVALVPNLFPWPWSLMSGAGTYRKLAAVCDGMAVKLYGMHWKMMFRFYANQLATGNPEIDSKLIVRCLLLLLDIVDPNAPDDLTAYNYPGPEESHGASAAAQQRKIDVALQGAGSTPIYVLAHGYGPVADFRDRFQVALHATPHGVWVNRYGYLSNEKLEAMREVAVR